MTTKVKIVGVVIAIVIALLAIGAFSNPEKVPFFGSAVNGGNVTDYDAVNVTGGYFVDGAAPAVIGGTGALTIGGSSGTTFTRLNGGLCDLNFGTTTSAIVASSTVAVDCQATNMLASATAVQAALPGVATGDAVFVQLASSTPTTYLGLKLNGCSASTTQGYITCGLTNVTGASITPATTTAHLLAPSPYHFVHTDKMVGDRAGPLPLTKTPGQPPKIIYGSLFRRRWFL